MNNYHYPRLNTFHGPKRQLLGNHAGHAAPAWKNAPVPGPSAIGKGKQVQLDGGSKIFLTRLPVDVKEYEVEELFRKTIGPLRECFLIYNSQGGSKGMAVVSFARPGDAMLAKAKYDGKVVDGRKPLKIEFISEAAQSSSGMPEGPPQAPSLLDRISNVGKSQSTAVNGISRPIQPFQPPLRRPAQMHAPPYPSIAVPPRHVRQKKGPRRIKKLRVPVSAAQLDKEMEDYRAGADMTGL